MNTAEDFVRRFADFWANPSPEQISGLLTSDVVLVQPLSAPAIGLDAAQALFKRLFSWLPDLRATVDGWAGDDSNLFIELHLAATIGGKRIEWLAVDRFCLREGKAAKRVSYFDAFPLVLLLLKTPAAWRGLWRSRAARSSPSGVAGT